MPSDTAQLPPLGNPNKAEKYVVSLINLIQSNKVEVIKTDLNKFDLTTMQDHYRIDLRTYDVEVSHNVHPDTDKNFYTMLFNNLARLADGSSKKVVLAYVHLTESQYKRFKIAADEQLEKKKLEEDAARFAQVMVPFDTALQAMDSQSQENLAPEPQIQPSQPIDNPFDQISDNPWSAPSPQPAMDDNP